MPKTNLETNYLMKKPTSYGNFRAPTIYFSNSTIKENFYSFNHSYNSASY